MSADPAVAIEVTITGYSTAGKGKNEHTVKHHPMSPVDAWFGECFRIVIIHMHWSRSSQ